MTGAVRAEASGASDRIAPRDNTPVCRDKCVLPVPLVIGVTGHRDLRPEDSVSLEQAVRGIFRDLRRRCPSTPLVLLSPLAEGADRLVARVALDEGASIRVPLPLPLEVYEQDFPDATSRQEFRALLGQASAIFTIGLKSGTSADSVRTPGPQRDGQYEALGAFIARNSLILIALWDGRDSDAVGGTAQVLSFQRSGLPTAYADIDDVSPLDMADTGPVYQVVTPRIGKPDPPAPAFTVIRLLPTCGWSTDASDEDISDTFDRILGCIDGFNADIRGRSKLDNRLVKGSDSNSIPARLEQLEIDFALADKLAIHYRDRTHQVLRSLFGLAFLAVFCFSVYAHWTHAEWPFLVLNVCVVAAAYVVYIYAGTIPFPFDWLRHLLGPDRAREIWRWRRDYKTRYLDYRALAEGMRVQFFWCLIGSPHQVADHYLRKQRGELDWIRAAIRGWTMVGTGSESMTRQEPHWTALDIAERNWVRDQRAFFRRRASANRRLAEWSHRTVHCFILAAALLSLVLIWLATPVAPPGYDLDRIREILVVPLVLLSAGAALIEGYLEKTAVSEQAKQYERIGMVFERAASGLERARQHGDGTKAVRILEELGNEALAENGDWVLLHRARPMEVRFEG